MCRKALSGMVSLADFEAVGLTGEERPEALSGADFIRLSNQCTGEETHG